MPEERAKQEYVRGFGPEAETSMCEQGEGGEGRKRADVREGARPQTTDVADSTPGDSDNLHIPVLSVLREVFVHLDEAEVGRD